jgi:hypothetical protein
MPEARSASGTYPLRHCRAWALYMTRGRFGSRKELHMPYVQPRQPLAALFQDSNGADLNQPVRHYLVDLPTPDVPYSTNRFLLAELVGEADQHPKPGLDIVIFHSVGKVILLGEVTAVLAAKMALDQPGRYRALVSCAPMATIADVDVPEGQEQYLAGELARMGVALDENRCPPTSLGKIPKGALMQDQSAASEFVLETLVDAALS